MIKQLINKSIIGVCVITAGYIVTKHVCSHDIRKKQRSEIKRLQEDICRKNKLILSNKDELKTFETRMIQKDIEILILEEMIKELYTTKKKKKA